MEAKALPLVETVRVVEPGAPRFAWTMTLP